MSFRIITAVAVAAALIASAVAVAAKPAKDSSFATKDNSFRFDTNKKGTKLINVNLYSKCSTVPAMEGWPNIKVNDKGEFAKEGSIENVLGEKVNFTIEGKFPKKKKAVGTTDVDTKDCSEKPQDFVAKKKGPAGGQG